MTCQNNCGNEAAEGRLLCDACLNLLSPKAVEAIESLLAGKGKAGKTKGAAIKASLIKGGLVTGKDVFEALDKAIGARLEQISDPQHRAKIEKRVKMLTGGFALVGIGPTRTTGEAVRLVGAALEEIIPIIAAAQEPPPGSSLPGGPFDAPGGDSIN